MQKKGTTKRKNLVNHMNKSHFSSPIIQKNKKAMHSQQVLQTKVATFSDKFSCTQKSLKQQTCNLKATLLETKKYFLICLSPKCCIASLFTILEKTSDFSLKLLLWQELKMKIELIQPNQEQALSFHSIYIQDLLHNGTSQAISVTSDSNLSCLM